MGRKLGGRRSIRLALFLTLDEAKDAVSNRKARMAAGAALALSLDGASLGWAIDHLPSAVAWATLTVSAATIVGGATAIGIFVARLDRKLAKVRRVRRLLDFVA